MLIVLLAVLAIVLAQDGTLANPWLITCGYRSTVREREWNIYRCYPTNLTVNNGDYVVVRTLNGGNIITFYGSLGPQTSVNPETTEANPLCFLGRTPIFGGQNLTESFNDGLLHYAFPSFVDGAVYITDTQKFYSSGIIMEDDEASRAKLFDLPAGTVLTADYLVRFNSTEAGPFNYASCFEPWVGGAVYIGTPDKTIADIDAGRATYHSNYDTRFLQLSDIHKLGGQYKTPETEENEEGFLTHLVKVGFAEASTDAFYNGFGTPNFTISAGDTVAFVSQWYREGREFVHTFKMNVSRDDANWVPEYHNYDTPAAYLVFPQPDAGGNLIFQPYFPRYQYITAFGMWDSGHVWLGFGDAANFEGGELSLGRLNADDQFSDEKNSKNMTLPKTGYFPYACTLHYSTNMHGKIQVLPRANARRNKYQIDATLNKVKLKHLTDYVAQDADWPNENHISWELVSGTHGILSTTSDAGSFETPLLVQFLVTYTLKDPRPFSQTGDLQPLQNNILQFIALRTWTETSEWDIQNVQTAVPKASTSTKRDTGDQVDVAFVLTFNSAGAMGWSLALFLTSLFLLLVQ